MCPGACARSHGTRARHCRGAADCARSTGLKIEKRGESVALGQATVVLDLNWYLDSGCTRESILGVNLPS